MCIHISLLIKLEYVVIKYILFFFIYASCTHVDNISVIFNLINIYEGKMQTLNSTSNIFARRIKEK